MLIEVNSPATFPLGLVKVGDQATGLKSCLLGLTVQHPPIQLFAQTHASQYLVSGPRADVAYDYGLHFLNHYRLNGQAEVEIELAIPSLVGLGSELLLGLSMAKALTWLHGWPAEKRQTLAYVAGLPPLAPHQALELWGFDQGGLLLIDLARPAAAELPAVIRRQEIEHTEKEAWAFVFYFPDDTADLSETLEAEQWAALEQAGPYLSEDTGQLLQNELWPAVEQDDINRFGRALLALQQWNEAALAQAGFPQQLSPAHQAVLELMADHGAVAWGKNLTGHSLYGLIKGGQPSRELRTILRHHVGFFGGRVMATITANQGARELITDSQLMGSRVRSIRLNPPRR
jgi:predicted sugar kinase